MTRTSDIPVTFRWYLSMPPTSQDLTQGLFTVGVMGGEVRSRIEPCWACDGYRLTLCNVIQITLLLGLDTLDILREPNTYACFYLEL